MVVIQQSKIQVLDTNEIDVISGGTMCFLWFCPALRIDGGDPEEPVGPEIEN